MADARADEAASSADFERAEATAPGEAPIYSAGKIHRGWMEIMKRIGQYNRNIPPLLEHAHVRAIEGNRLILGVSSEFFQQKIADPQRAKYIEQAIDDLHKVKLRIEARVVSGIAPPEAAASDENGEEDDPLLAKGKELGGVIDDRV